MPPTRPPYPAELKRQIVELVRAGRSPSELAREFEPTAQTIQNWVRQADRDKAFEKMALRAMSAKSCVVFGARTSSCALSARYCQKQQPGSQRRPTR